MAGPPLTRIQWPFPIHGLNTEASAKYIPATALSAVSNMYYQTPYLLRSRGGIDAATSYTISGSGTGPLYYWGYNSKLYRSASTVTGVCSFGVGATPLIYACVSGVINTYDGTTLAPLTGTSVPSANLVMSRFGCLWAAKSTLYPDRIFVSEAGDATVWSGVYQGKAGWFDVAPGEDGGIQDWIDWNQTLYVFKTRGIYRVTGDSITNLAWRRLCSVDGFLPGTIADCGQGVLYATKHGVFPLGLTQEDEVRDLTRSVETQFQTFVASGAKAAYSPELGCYVVVNGSTTAWAANLNNRPDVWTKFTLPASMTGVYSGNGFWFATSGQAYLYDHDDFVDGSSAFTVSFKTGDWDLGTMLLKKRIAYVEGPYNAGDNATATASLYKDGSGSAVTSNAMAATATPLWRCNFNCDRLALGVAYTSLSAPCSFGGVTVHCYVLPDKNL